MSLVSDASYVTSYDTSNKVISRNPGGRGSRWGIVVDWYFQHLQRSFLGSLEILGERDSVSIVAARARESGLSGERTTTMMTTRGA